MYSEKLRNSIAVVKDEDAVSFARLKLTEIYG